jgi:hypothetical protein
LRKEAAVKDELRRLRLDAERRKLAEIMDPVAEIAQQLHAMVHEVVSAALDSLRRNQATLHGSTARGLSDLVRRYRALDITDDEQLRAMLRDVEQELAKPTGTRRKRDTTEIAALLEELKAHTYERSRLLLDPTANAIVELGAERGRACPVPSPRTQARHRRAAERRNHGEERSG